GGVSLDVGAAEHAVAALGDSLGMSAIDTAAGIARVASAEMARAVRVMTVERGIDPRDLALLAFGGAGPLHATAIAAELDMRRVVVPQASGVLSALGMLVSERRRDLVESVLLVAQELNRQAIAQVVERLAERGRDELGEPDAVVRASYDLRYAGQAFELTVDGDAAPDPDDLRDRFDRAHADRYGYADDDAELELVTVRVAVALPGAELPGGARGEHEEAGTRRAIFDGAEHEAAIHRGAPERVEGPAIVELPEATLVVPPGWRGGATDDGTVVISRA
ncbi:MAG: N-methylhydantoinase, partial [Solirubrobacteraceae bacterium]|nr:N-methylhydantoinase [Solirubrobacteraceae bacterium]